VPRCRGTHRITLPARAVLLCALGLAAARSNADAPKLIIGGANFQPFPLAVAPFLPPQGGPPAEAAAGEIYQTLVADLTDSGLFDPAVLNPKGYLADGHEPMSAAAIRFDRWTSVGAEGLVKAQVRYVPATHQLSAEFKLFDTIAGIEQMDRTLNASPDHGRQLAHRFADELLQFFTGEPGPFESPICYVKQVARWQKEIFVSDWDGHGERQVTRSGKLNLLPSWSVDGRRIAYTSYQLDHPDLWELTLPSLQTHLLSKRGDLSSGAAFSPDGKRVALTMSEDGNPDIYLMDLTSGSMTRLTDAFGIDSSPSWSPDGRQIAFVSQRAGSPQIFVMSSDGSGVRRLTFQGTYNQTPRWSPRGDQIAFTGRDERAVFDLFTLNIATGKVARITQDQGNNAEPSWAPNGRLLVFTSTRSGRSEVWVSTPDGASQHQLTQGGGYATPAWSPSTSPH
jgi:TolB protein